MTNTKKMNEILKGYERNEFNLAEVLRDIYKGLQPCQVFFDTETLLFSSSPDETTNYKQTLEGETMRADVFTVVVPEFLSVLVNGDFIIEDYSGMQGLAPFDLQKIKEDKEKQEKEEEQEISWYEFSLNSHQDFFEEIEKIDKEDFIEGEVVDFLESESQWILEKFEEYLKEYFAIS